MRILSCIAAAAALLFGAPAAFAHQGNPNYRSVVSKITPAVPGVSVTVLNYDDRLALHNTSGKDVTILDYQGKPYARVLADGTVAVNTNSEAYYLNEDRLGEATVPKGLGIEPSALEATVPERGAKLAHPPARIAFHFDEPVEASFGALRVFDSRGREVQTGTVFHPGGKGPDVAVRLRPGLGDSTYTATYRVISADGHPAFWAAARPDVVDEVLGTRFGSAWGLGAVAWAIVLAALATRPLRPAKGRTAIAPAPVPAAAPLGELVAAGPHPPPAASSAAAAPHPPPAAAARPAASSAAGPRLTLLAAPLLALVALPAFGGHASVQKPVAMLLGANLLHVLAMSAWLGGIAVLVLALRAATAELDPGARTPQLAGVVGRFSALASIALPVLVLSGVVQTIVEVGSFGALFGSAFGRVVLIKIGVALAIVGLGAVNRQRLLPALRRAAAGAASPGRSGVLLRRTLRAELALGLTAIAVTGALSGYAPSIAESSGPCATTVSIGPARLEVTVDPARVGPNQVHLSLFDRRSGAPFQATKEMRVTAALPSKRIAALALSPHVAGPGHYIVDGASLAVTGDWTVSVTDRVSDFDEYETRFTVPIR